MRDQGETERAGGGRWRHGRDVLSRPLRVLLVETDESLALALCRLFSELPVRVDVTRASTFAEAVERMTSPPPFDVHLVACRLGAHGGAELVAAYRAAGGEVPTLLLSDRGDRAEDLEAMASGAADYLDRGRLDAATLERSLRYAVAAARGAEEIRRGRDELAARVAERTDALETMNAALVAEVSERRAAERALREADRRKDEFLATLAHELRNPLAPLTSAAEILSIAGNEDEGRRTRAVRVIERQVEQMARLIGDLVDVSRITHGKLELRRERVSLPSVVESALETARPLLDGRRQELELAMPDEALVLHVDPMRVAQVLTNLLSNAAKYTEPGGRVRLEAAREDGDLVVSVVDSGIGIPRSHLAHVFTMFGQGPRAHQAVKGGLGIGLALSRSIVERHGGSLEAWSEGEGKGSRFTLRIPRAFVAAGAAPAPAPAADAVQPLRILVVDDNAEAALTLSELLELQGHETHVAHDGPSGVEAARRLRPDVAIFDLGLPGIDGHAAARRLRADPALSGMLLLALSGRVQESDVARSREAGFDHHLAKPVQLRALEPLLRRASGGRDRIP